MNGRKFTICVSVVILNFFAAFPSQSAAQRRAKTTDDCMSFEREFLQAFYPELSGKKCAITFETASSYDNPVSDTTEFSLSMLAMEQNIKFFSVGWAAGWEGTCRTPNCDGQQATIFGEELNYFVP
jgi:hypothetical protein